MWGMQEGLSALQRTPAVSGMSIEESVQVRQYQATEVGDVCFVSHG
jgi:hypothetical protein